MQRMKLHIENDSAKLNTRASNISGWLTVPPFVAVPITTTVMISLMQCRIDTVILTLVKIPGQTLKQCKSLPAHLILVVVVQENLWGRPACIGLWQYLAASQQIVEHCHEIYCKSYINIIRTIHRQMHEPTIFLFFNSPVCLVNMLAIS